jgi:hypothetical protein
MPRAIEERTNPWRVRARGVGCEKIPRRLSAELELAAGQSDLEPQDVRFFGKRARGEFFAVKSERHPRFVGATSRESASRSFEQGELFGEGIA